MRRINKSEYIVSKGSNVTDEVHSCRHIYSQKYSSLHTAWLKILVGKLFLRIGGLRAIRQYFICQKLQCDVTLCSCDRQICCDKSSQIESGYACLLCKAFQDVTTLQQQNKRAWHVTSKHTRLSGGGVIKSSVRILYKWV